jgi:hypothetical protein
MIPTRALREKAMQLLAADAATLAPAVLENVIILVMNDIAPSEETVVGDLDEATFDGYAALDCALGTQPEGLDPANNDSLVDILPAAGMFRWETSGVTNLPQTIYGFALLDSTKATLLACERFEDPVTLTAVNQRVEVGTPQLRQQANSVS